MAALHARVLAGAVANGRCRDFNIGIGGGTAGDAVILSLRGPLTQGMMLYGVRVTAPGTMVIKLCNFTGGASPVITDLPVRVMTFG